MPRSIPGNGQFLHGKSNFCVELPEEIKLFRKFAWKNRFFLKLSRKSKFLDNLPGKIDFYPDLYDPQISNQIDAAVEVNVEHGSSIYDLISSIKHNFCSLHVHVIYEINIKRQSDS